MICVCVCTYVFTVCMYVFKSGLLYPLSLMCVCYLDIMGDPTERSLQLTAID